MKLTPRQLWDAIDHLVLHKNYFPYFCFDRKGWYFYHQRPNLESDVWVDLGRDGHYNCPFEIDWEGDWKDSLHYKGEKVVNCRRLGCQNNPCCDKEHDLPSNFFTVGTVGSEIKFDSKFGTIGANSAEIKFDSSHVSEKYMTYYDHWMKELLKPLEERVAKIEESIKSDIPI